MFLKSIAKTKIPLSDLTTTDNKSQNEPSWDTFINRDKYFF